MIDLVCLVADKSMEAVVGAVLDRPEALGIRPVTRTLLVHPQRDSACFHDPVPQLRGYRRDASHALVLLDRRSPRLDAALGWQGNAPPLEEQLAAVGLWQTGSAKPGNPKRAIEWALRQVRRPRSSSIYREIAATLGIRGCTDPSFRRFQTTLQAWFPRP
ncbi:MAG: hypothetical protein FJ265_11085 [Planctomycetes bacterium]|nr:hypothetical protein [Planctomycetota bacterium]